jgi:hypothetical protein
MNLYEYFKNDPAIYKDGSFTKEAYMYFMYLDYIGAKILKKTDALVFEAIKVEELNRMTLTSLAHKQPDGLSTVRLPSYIYQKIFSPYKNIERQDCLENLNALGLEEDSSFNLDKMRSSLSEEYECSVISPLKGVESFGSFLCLTKNDSQLFEGKRCFIYHLDVFNNIRVNIEDKVFIFDQESKSFHSRDEPISKSDQGSESFIMRSLQILRDKIWRS